MKLITEPDVEIKGPDGCIGILYVFKSKKSAKKYDKTAKLSQVYVEED